MDSSLENPRSSSPAHSSVSARSSKSKDEHKNFRKEETSLSEEHRPHSPSDVSEISYRSKEEPKDFRSNSTSLAVEHRSASSTCSDVSVKSYRSKEEQDNLRSNQSSLSEEHRPHSPSDVSEISYRSKEEPEDFRSNSTSLDEEQRSASPNCSDVSEKSYTSMEEPENFRSTPNQSSQSNNQTSRTDQTPTNPKTKKKTSRSQDSETKQRIQQIDKKKILDLYKEELDKLQQDSELWDIMENNTCNQIKKYEDLFPHSHSTVRTVLTKGIAGIGKTFQTKRFMVDWARGKSNKDIDFIVPLCFGELRGKRKEDQSMNDLLSHFLGSVEESRSFSYEYYKVAFVLDGLEKWDLTLDFEKNEKLSDMTTPAPMNVLLTNLIEGTLFSSALVWIISQPSGVDNIPPKYINRVTECRESSVRRKQLVSDLKKRFLQENKDGSKDEINHPNQKNTEHIIKEISVGENTDVEEREEAMAKSEKPQVNAPSDIFKTREGSIMSFLLRRAKEKIRTVLTVGEANVGKSFHVKGFLRAWAKNNDAEVVFPLDFSKLKLINNKVSLVGLLHHFFKETKKSVISDYARFKTVFVLDGLDAYEHILDFENNEILNDVRQPASVNSLLTNLIKGELLPKARVWITSRPSAVEKLPVDCIDRMTEIREKPDIASQRKLKTNLQERFTFVSEGIDGQNKSPQSSRLNKIYMDLYIIDGERGEVTAKHECRQVQDANFKQEETPIKCCDIFKSESDNKRIKTVLTIGIAGIGKSFASMKYMLDWAESKVKENIYYTFPLPFRELNLRKKKQLSFEELLYQFFPFMKTSEISDFNKYNILVVLDGYDECCLDLDFSEKNYLNDVKKQTSVNVLLSNLIQGNLLPEAQIWITSRPAAFNIPAGKIDRMTEVRGFHDEQKEEYFRKRFSDEALAEKILTHVKKSRSLFIMCHIPLFCWMTSTVLEEVVNLEQEEGLPKTLTNMYAHFLLLQCRQGKVKYSECEKGESLESDSCWNRQNKETILSLGKLAFEELVKGNLLFTEENLTECGIDITRAVVYSGLLSQVKREGQGLYPQKFFCFVHLSIQEFLGALHVYHTFSDKGENLLAEPVVSGLHPSDFYKQAVDKALGNAHGDWDLFLRFLLGLSLDTNQDLLRELLQKMENNEKTNNETAEYINGKIDENICDPDKNMNLFHCLNELNDHSLIAKVKKYLQSDKKPFKAFTPSQWSALTYVLLMSDEKLDVFDLKKYLRSEDVLLGMLPVVKVSQTALLSWCELTEKCCRGLKSSVLCSASSNLTELDLSHNDLLDSGVEQVAEGLKSIHCKLEILKLSGCQVSKEGCAFLASALKSNAASKLNHLNLSYNHPGDDGKMLLSAIAKLKRLCFDHCGEHRLKPGMQKYEAVLTLDENTASRRLFLCDANRKAAVKFMLRDVRQPENKNRFKRTQVLCDKGLNCISYWEVEWEGEVGIAVAYEGVSRSLDSSGGFGTNDKSWNLVCSEAGGIARAGKQAERIEHMPCKKIGVLLDWEAGELRYYNVSSEGLSLIHTVEHRFTEPVFPGFWVQRGSVTLCDISTQGFKPV